SMPRATCRCGHTLNLPDDRSDRVVCPKCGARARIRFLQPEDVTTTPDGYIRFFCPCGRRLKVSAQDTPPQGRCPYCGRVLPVPADSTGARPPGHPDATTAELSPSERAALDRWIERHGAAPA